MYILRGSAIIAHAENRRGMYGVYKRPPSDIMCDNYTILYYSIVD